MKQRATAEEMKKQATERLGETRRRHSVEADLDNEDQGMLVTPEKRRRRSNFDVMKILEESLAAKKEQQEESNRLRARKIALMEKQICQPAAVPTECTQSATAILTARATSHICTGSSLAELVAHIKKKNFCYLMKLKSSKIIF